MALTSTAYSFGFQPKQPSFHSGWVMARSVERDEDGKVKWSTFDAQGKQTPLGVECDETCTVISGKAFDGWLQGFQDFSTQALNKDLVQGAAWMTAEAYVQGKGEFKTVDGQQRMNAPDLSRSTRSVFVRSKKQWYTPDSRIVLFESPLDQTAMQGNPLALGDNGAVLLDKDGKLVKSSPDNIGLAVKWFDGERYGAEEIVPAGSRPTNAPIMGQTQIYGGIPGIVIEGPTAFDEPKTMSESGSGDDETANRRGFYFLRYLVPCIPNDFVDYQSMLAARLPYSRFTPTTAYPSYTYATRLVSDYCNSVGLGLGGATTLVGLMGNVEAIAVHATLAMPMDRSPIYVDVLYMTGKIKMQNADGSPVQFGGETQYGAINPTAAEKTVLGPFDFDGDGKADRSERGNVDAQQNFTPDAEGDKVAIYLSSDPAGVPVKNAQGQVTGHRPHFVRLIDEKTDPKAGGYTVLNTVSLTDLKDTDLYLYRTSNGHLVKHQARLTDNDFKNKDGQLPASGDVQWGYVMNYLGPQAYRPPTRSWADLQNETVSRTDGQGESKTAYTDNALKAKREADHLRIGESLTLVAINRKTGYMGTTTARVEAPGSSGSGSLSFKVNDLILRPPNLKIMAVREYEVEAGATKGQMRSYNIGMEGAALKKDKYVEIDSLWLDENDQMLPEDLGTRGYTGRLAKVAGDKLNDTQVSQFKIQPGLHKNMIKLGAGGQGDLGNEHYYLHVSGGVKDDAEAFRKPDFSTLGGDESGIWSSRPKWAVPFKVTTSREVQDLQEQMAYHDTRNDSEPNSEAPKNPQANYGWEYRPEFQFSVFDLKVKQILQCKGDNGQPATDCTDGAVNTITVYDKQKDIDTAFIDPGMDLLKILFSLQLPVEQRLEGFVDPELLLALGGSEHKLDQSGDLSELYGDLSALSLVDSADYLSMRLYMNSDPGNILWEYVDPIIAGVEITQVIQDYQSMEDLAQADPKFDLATYSGSKVAYPWKLPVPLIAGKKTAVRVYLKPHDTEKYRYKVKVIANGQALQDPLTLEINPQCDERKQRDGIAPTVNGRQLCKSADFFFVPTESANAVNVIVKREGKLQNSVVDLENITFNVNALSSKKLTFNVFQYCDGTDAQPGKCVSNSFDVAREAITSVSVMQRLPVAPDKVEFQSSGTKVSVPPDANYEEHQLGGKSVSQWNSELGITNWAKKVVVKLGEETKKYDSYTFAVMPMDDEIVTNRRWDSAERLTGIARRIPSNAFIFWNDVDKNDTIPHEIGHMLGRSHTGLTTNSCAKSPLGDVKNWIYPDNYLHKLNDKNLIVPPKTLPEVGYDFSDPKKAKPASNKWYELMSYCSAIWVSSYTYKGMLWRLYPDEMERLYPEELSKFKLNGDQ